MKNSQQIAEPVDEEFFRLFSSAVEIGINLVRNLDHRRIYLGDHISFHRVYSTQGNSIPSFTPTSLKNYGSAFGSNPISPINWTKQKAINDLLSYVLANERIHGYFRTAKYTLAGDNYQLSDDEVKLLFIGLYGGQLICACTNLLMAIFPRTGSRLGIENWNGEYLIMSWKLI